MKQCSKCLQFKSLSEFHVHKQSKDGLHGWCKKCCYLYNKEWRKENPEKRRNCQKRWAKDNPEKIKALSEKQKDKNTDYYRKIKDKYGLGAGTVLRYGFRLALKIYEKYDRKCSMCGSEYDLTIHHIDGKGRNYENKGLKPNNSEDNLIVVCRRCHGRIHGKQAWSKRKRKE